MQTHDLSFGAIMYHIKELDFAKIYTIHADTQEDGKTIPIIRVHINESGDVTFSYWNKSTGKWRYFNIEQHEVFKNISRKYILSRQMYVTQDLPPMEELCECLIAEVKYILSKDSE